MSSALVGGARCHCALAAVPHLEPARSGYGCSRRSAIPEVVWVRSNASQFETLGGNVRNSRSASSSCSGSSSTVWRCCGLGGGEEAGAGGIRRGAWPRAVGESSCGDSVEFRGGSAAVQQMQRRELVRVVSSWFVLPALVNAGSACGAAAAAEEDDGQGPESSTITAPPAKTLVEKLLERSKANKARYDQERLDAYYRRNYKDYFGFLKGNIENKDKASLTEAEKGILRWLEKNQ